MKVVRSWSLVSSFLLIKLMVNCMKGLLNSSTCSRSELMVSGEVDKSACCVRKSKISLIVILTRGHCLKGNFVKWAFRNFLVSHPSLHDFHDKNTEIFVHDRTALIVFQSLFVSWLRKWSALENPPKKRPETCIMTWSICCFKNLLF